MVFFSALLVYLETASPNVAFWDCGEFVTTSYVLGVPHPPGAPLYTILGRVFTLLPIAREIAFRVNLISVLAASFSVLLIYLVVVRLLCAWMNSDAPGSRIAILAGGITSAFSVAFGGGSW